MTTVEKLLVANLVGEVAIVGVVIQSHNKQLDASVDLKTGIGIVPSSWMGPRMIKEKIVCWLYK